MIEWIQHNARESQAPTTQYDVERSYASLEPGYRQGLTMKDYNISKRYVDLYITRQARLAQETETASRSVQRALLTPRVHPRVTLSLQ